VEEVKVLTAQLKEKHSAENALINSKSYQLAADPKLSWIAPTSKPEVPAINFSTLEAAIKSLQQSAANLNSYLNSKPASDKKTIARVNQALFQAERSLLIPEGLPKRAWYKHSIYAPGFYTGYGVKTLPGVREAIEQNNWTEADTQLQTVTKRISALAQTLDQITQAK